MRLHRFIAQCGVTSRRKAEDWIAEGRVQVNGETVTTMGVSVDIERDVVLVDGNPISQPDSLTYALNKPKGVVTTLSDPQGRRTIAEFIPESLRALKPVGRLDMATEGLLLLTTDGELAARLTHPRHGVEKEYMAEVVGLPNPKDIDRLREGVMIEGGRTRPAQVEIAHWDETRNKATVKVVIHEGRKHQVRQMLAAVGHPVDSLKRVRVGQILLKGLARGEMRKLGKTEVDALKRLSGL